MKKVLLVVGLLAMLLALLPTSVSAAISHHLFSGTVTMDGEPYSSEYEVSVRVGGIETVSLSFVDSKYYVFVVRSNSRPTNGEGIDFYVDDIYATTAQWFASGNTILDLDIVTGGEVVPPEEPIEPSTPIESSSSGIPAGFSGLAGTSVGGTVQAKLGSLIVGTATVGPDGKYYMLVVPQGNLPEGSVLSFYVEGVLKGNCTWTSGGYNILNLGGEVIVPVVPLVALEDNPSVSVGLASIWGKVYSITSFKQGEGLSGWTIYNPSWPSSSNTLTTLHRLRGYWVDVSENCTLVYGSNTYELDGGWNLIGWGGK